MGGGVDGGVGIGIRTSPRQAAIEKAQAELRQEYDVREERRKELEFLEKGGNPLDFKFGNVASLSLQSTSLGARHLEQFHSSEAKGSFALAASPRGDSVESSGRPGPPVSGRKCTDNPVLFDGENEILEGEKNSVHLARKNNITSSEHSSQLDGNRNAKESEDSAIFRPYARRNRTRTNRDGARFGSADGVHNRSLQGSSFASRASIRDGKGSLMEASSQKEKSKHLGINGDMVSSTATRESRLDGQIDGEQALPSSTSLKQIGLPTDKMEVIAKSPKGNNRHKQPSGISKKLDLVRVDPETVSAGTDGLPLLTKEREIDSSGKLNGFSDDFKGDSKAIGDEVQKIHEEIDRKGSDSSIHPSVCMDLKKDNVCNDAVKISSNGSTVAQSSESEKKEKLAGAEMVEQEDINKIVDSNMVTINEDHFTQQNQSIGGEETHGRSDLLVKEDTLGAVEYEHEKEKGTENERDERNLYRDSNLVRDNVFLMRPPLEMSSCEAPSTSLYERDIATPDRQASGNNLSLADKAYEDSVLEEARIIRAKHKRIAELSLRTSPLENRQRCQWNFVLEEMAWLANDFAQERIWKMTASAQLCHRIASLRRYRCEEQSQMGKLKLVAHNMAKAVMQFWHYAEVLLKGDDPNLGMEAGKSGSMGSQRNNGGEVSDKKTDDPCKESSENMMPNTPGRNVELPIYAYAVQFLRNSNPHVYQSYAQAPKTPDIVSDIDMPQVSWDDHFTEESLFYTIPSGAMETYRKSIEAYVTKSEKTGSDVQEEVGTSFISDQGYQDNAYDEDEAETSMYYMPGVREGSSKSTKFVQKKRKNPRLYEQGADVLHGHYTTSTQPSSLMEKNPANLTVGSIPAKRMRTANASRQRVSSPFGTGAYANIQAQAKTEVSSGDTNSFHDDHNPLHGGSRFQKGGEVESARDFGKHVSYDYAETSAKPKKKKKSKHLDSTFEPSWQLGSAALLEQREQSKKRSEHLESNGTGGLYGQHNAKKHKMMKQSLENSYDNSMSMSGSIPCPSAPQMSNMSNQNRLMRYIGGRDKSKKAKSLKASALHSGPGSLWSLFEDQALVVLVHDMGPNWELVSDAINSTLQFKCIFRKPKECKERHKFLMDKNAGDGGDSAEDSGSSQSYPSTLPGIPKGSARQLFQRLQGPVEEGTLKEHFDKIIQIAQRQHHQRIQLKNESQDLKQIPVHNSHFVALSQVCPNNLNGVVLTPLDLTEATSPSPDAAPLSYQGSHSSNLAMQNQSGALSSALAASGVNSPLPGSSSFGLGNNTPAAGPFGATMRDGRYNISKTSSPLADEQHRMQYNQMMSNRTITQSNLSIPGSERGVRAMPGGNGLGMNRTTMARPGFPGMPSSPMLNSSSVLSSPTVGAQSPINMHAGPGAAQGRPRNSMHMPRGGHNTEQQRQMPAQELPMHLSQVNTQGVHPFNGVGPAFSNQTNPPVQTYPGHLQQQQSNSPNNPHHQTQVRPSNHGTASQLQQINVQMAKERLVQQRHLQQQQPHFAASNNLMPHVQSQPPQLQSPSQSASLPPLTPSSPMTPMVSQQQKNQLTHHAQGLTRNPQANVGGLTNQVSPKQRQRPAQPLQRSHPMQRPQLPPQQLQAKFLKGNGRSNPSPLNGLSVAPGSMVAEKEMVQQSQGLYSGQGINQVQPSKPSISQGPAAPHSTKQQTQKQAVAIPPGHNTSSVLNQAVPSTLTSPQMGQMQAQPHNQMIQTQAVSQRMHAQNRQHMNYGQLNVKSHLEKAHATDQKLVGTTPAAARVDSAIKTAPAASTPHDASKASTSAQIGHVSSPTLLSSMIEQLPSLGQAGIGQRHSVENLAYHGGGVAMAKQLSGPLPSSQEHYQPQSQEQHEQGAPQQQQTKPQPHQPPQTQHLQANQGSLYIGPTNS